MSFWDNKKINKKGKAYRKTLTSNELFIGISIFSTKIKQPKRTVLSASMTLEAVFIFPLVLFFSVILIHVLNLVNFQNRVNEVMYDTSRTLSKLEYAALGSANQVSALAMLWCDLDDATVKSIGVTGGNVGLVSLNSDFENEEVDFVINYVSETPFDFLKILDYSCCQRACVRKWIGNEDKGDGGTDETGRDDDMVYITESGTVYHLDRDCTHIRLSVKNVAASQISDLRNTGGGKFYPCEICGETPGNAGNLYITTTGTRYHSNINCSGLKRAVFMVPLSEVSDWPACSRCGR